MSLSKSLSMPSWSKERGDSVTSLSSGQNRLPENLMNGQMLLERTCFRRTSSTTNFSPAPCIGKIWREKDSASSVCASLPCLLQCQLFSVSAFTNLFASKHFWRMNTWRMWQAQRFSDLVWKSVFPGSLFKVPSSCACVFQHCGFCG